MATSNWWHRTETQFAPRAWTRGAEKNATLAGKRAFDVALSVTGLCLGMPLMAVGAAAVCLESGGSVLTRTRCWGREGRIFERLRLRTTDRLGRMTWAGRVLCRLGIDGLPQLVNVLRGEMSIVGAAPVPAGGCDETAVRHLRRFESLPGITGLWALGSCLGDVPVREYFAPDEFYRMNWSPWLDLAMVARTLGAVASGADF